MTPEAEKLLKEILQALTAACHREMGTEWCKQMFAKIDELSNVGKP